MNSTVRRLVCKRTYSVSRMPGLDGSNAYTGAVGGLLSVSIMELVGIYLFLRCVRFFDRGGNPNLMVSSPCRSMAHTLLVECVHSGTPSRIRESSSKRLFFDEPGILSAPSLLDIERSVEYSPRCGFNLNIFRTHPAQGHNLKPPSCSRRTCTYPVSRIPRRQPNKHTL